MADKEDAGFGGIVGWLVSVGSRLSRDGFEGRRRIGRKTWKA